MSQNNINENKSVDSSEWSLHKDYFCFMSEDSKNRLDTVSDVILLMRDYLNYVSDDEHTCTKARGIKAICILISGELENLKSELNYPGGLFSEFQAMHGISLIKKYGIKKLTKALEQLSDDGR